MSVAIDEFLNRDIKYKVFDSNNKVWINIK